MAISPFHPFLKRSNPSGDTASQRRLLRRELLSIESLEQYARTLASEQQAMVRPVAAKPLPQQAEKSARLLEDAQAQLSEVARRQLPLMPGDEWLLDNYHVVRDTTVEVGVGLPKAVLSATSSAGRRPLRWVPASLRARLGVDPAHRRGGGPL